MFDIFCALVLDKYIGIIINIYCVVVINYLHLLMYPHHITIKTLTVTQLGGRIQGEASSTFIVITLSGSSSVTLFTVLGTSYKIENNSYYLFILF